MARFYHTKPQVKSIWISLIILSQNESLKLGNSAEQHFGILLNTGKCEGVIGYILGHAAYQAFQPCCW